MMNHISFLDAMVLTGQVFLKIAINFGPVLILGILAIVLVEVIDAKR